MRFTDAYAACPVCSPTRASHHDGQVSEAGSTSLTDFIPGRSPAAVAKLDYRRSLKQQTAAEFDTTLAELLPGARGVCNGCRSASGHLGPGTPDSREQPKASIWGCYRQHP